MPTANEIRQQFIDYFVQKHGHSFAPSSSVLPLDDPTLMFTTQECIGSKNLAQAHGRAERSLL